MKFDFQPPSSSRKSYWKNAITWISSTLPKFKRFFFNVTFYHICLQCGQICLHIRNPLVSLDKIFMFVFHYKVKNVLKLGFSNLNNTVDQNWLWWGLSTSIHSSAPKGSKSNYWFIYRKFKNYTSNLFLHIYRSQNMQKTYF